jgi:hypothetical protein
MVVRRYGSLRSRCLNSALLLLTVVAAGVLAADATTSTPTANASPNPAPAVTGVLPDHGPPSGGTSVAITGTNLAGVTAVEFGSADAESVIVNSETSITAISPSQAEYWGIVDVTVTGPDGTSAKSPQDRFGYGPIVDQMTPRQGPAVGGTSVTLAGFGLQGATGVDFGTTPALGFAANPDGSITAVSPPATAGAAVVGVSVMTPEGASTTYYAPDTEPVNFFAYGPTVTSVAPDEGPATGGTPVMIHGSGFTSPVFRGLGGPFVHAVDFGSTELRCGLPWPSWRAPCASIGFEVKSDTEMTAIAPPGTGVVDVKVETDGGASPISSMDQFTYVPPDGTLNPERHGLVQLVNCRNAKHGVVKVGHRRKRGTEAAQRICTSRFVSGPVRTGRLAARLVRGDVLYATGTATVGRTKTRLALKPLKPVRPGRYELTLSSRRGQRHEMVAIR